ncbi:hypothetical protein B0T26DRAFT_756057 [Lasiosphaeria miniovina]|uniref:Uncharacterized protein n=1 Tax=Lasiosphaeria miniovina TaxID=1954250 RepID=A0AA40DKI1_9PEZI|nr:uncharacterized protein B0T26DRAFT_756057 [Lasiosphaeria miniovina]KAK0706565.1 hypothetical protein B0T26DRAFT_756057 [Lasiosphaeria miniovina]
MSGKSGYLSESGGFAKYNCENFNTPKACAVKTFVNGSVCSVCMGGDFDYPELTKDQKEARIRENMARARRGGSHGGSRGASGGGQNGYYGGGQGGGQADRRTGRLQWRRTMIGRIEHGHHEEEPGPQPALGREHDTLLCCQFDAYDNPAMDFAKMAAKVRLPTLDPQDLELTGYVLGASCREVTIIG